MLVKELNKKCRVIGVYGLIGSGKSSFALLLSQKIDAFLIDVDKIGKEALIYKKNEIVAEFSSDILENDEISRDKLKKIVFSDKNKLQKLESISHPYIYNRVCDTIKSIPAKKYIIIDAALLFKIKLDILCDYNVYIEAKEDNIIKRVSIRDKMSKDIIKNVIENQSEIKNKKPSADIIISNFNDFNSLKKKAIIIGDRICKVKN